MNNKNLFNIHGNNPYLEVGRSHIFFFHKKDSFHSNPMVILHIYMYITNVPSIVTKIINKKKFSWYSLLNQSISSMQFFFQNISNNNLPYYLLTIYPWCVKPRIDCHLGAGHSYCQLHMGIHSINKAINHIKYQVIKKVSFIN